MEIDIRTQADFHFTLSDAEFEILVRLSASHYDHVCKSASKDGGFLNRWQRSHEVWKECENPDGVKELTATFRDLDTCLKIMEMPTLITNAEQLRLLRNMRKHFLAVLSRANQGYHEWQYDYVGRDLT